MRPKAVTPIMPENTAVPSVWRSSAPAPTAQTSGTTPKMKANDVIRIGRSRSLAASIAPLMLELAGELDDQNGVLGGEADQHDETDLGQDVVVLAAQDHAADRRNQAHGHDQ